MSTEPAEAADASTEAGAVTWCDLAPWLAGRGSDPEFYWIDDEVAGADPEVLRANSELIAVLMAETLTEIPVGELLPMLPGGVDLIPDDALPTRAANWLLSSSSFTTDRIRGVSPAEILDSRGMGSGSVIGLLSRLVELSAEAAGRTGGDDRARAAADVLDDLTTIARWRRVTGGADVPLLDPLPAHAPAAVHEARTRLGGLTAGSPAVATGPLDVAQRLSERLSALPDRDREVFAARRLTADRVRLETLGERYGVSRERVRQYEARALDDLFGWLDTDSAAQLLITSATRLIGTVRPLADLLAALEPLGEEVPAVGHPLWRVLTGIGVPFEVAEGWAAAPDLESAREATAELLTTAADEFGVADPAALRGLNGAGDTDEPESDPQWPLRWAQRSGAVVYRDRILVRTTTVEDYAAAILSIHGAPMTADELVAAFHTERSPRTLVNQMIGDDRFQRAGRTRWGLSRWGGRAYETIRSAIGTLLDSAGGSAPLAAIVDELTTAYDVKPSSVSAYAAAPPYQTVDGIVSRADRRPQPRKSPAETRQLYRIGAAWKLRVTVNREHLRGSGAPLPVALATVLGLEYGRTRQLAGDHGAQSVAWTSLQPTLGSTRRFFTGRHPAEGDEVFFVFTDDGRFAVEPAVPGTGAGWERALAAIGAPAAAGPDEAAEVLATAAGLPRGSSAQRIRAAYTARGEDDLAALIADPAD